MYITSEINGEPKETDVVYISGQNHVMYSITETPEGHIKVIALSNTGRITVQPSSHNAIELI